MSKQTYSFREGEVLLVDKPLEWTSFDVVNKLRWNLSRKFKIKRFKVGHAGTLDPLATGLLVICTGKATKLSESLTAENKTYTGTFLLGKTTPSYDLETDFDQCFDTIDVTPEKIHQTAQQFIGEQLQYPPIFSAKKIAGKRAYELARKGKEVEMKANKICLYEFKITEIRGLEVDFHINCSKGTYIRSIAHDFGQKLKTGATLIKLRRIQSGNLSIKDAKSVEEWVEIINQTEVEI